MEQLKLQQASGAQSKQAMLSSVFSSFQFLMEGSDNDKSCQPGAENTRRLAKIRVPLQSNIRKLQSHEGQLSYATQNYVVLQRKQWNWGEKRSSERSTGAGDDANIMANRWQAVRKRIRYFWFTAHHCHGNCTTVFERGAPRWDCLWCQKAVCQKHLAAPIFPIKLK